jgi:MHS family alpha-ketoglutarate permease-like MFS transporter
MPVTTQRAGNRRTLVAVGLGHALEWYDWGIYATFVSFFAGQFFDSVSQVSAVLSSLAVFAVGFLARPLGGLLVGRLADRVGRKPMMVLTIGGMALASLIIAFSPSYATIGLGASAILLVARIMQGMATGGELPSAQTYLAETSPARHRGQWSSVIYIASVGGNTVGVLLGLILTVLLSNSEMDAYGWRIPFMAGGIFGAVALWVRHSLAETDTFTSQEAAKKAPGSTTRRPWADVWRYRKQGLQVVGLSVGPTVVYYSWVVAAPAYAISSLHIPSTPALLAGVLASLLLIACLPLWGTLSDRIGRRPILLVGTVGTAVVMFPLQALVRDNAWQLGVAMAIAMLLIGAVISILPAAYAEMFPTSIRTLGLAVPYSIAVAAFGGTAPYLQTWIGGNAGQPVFTGYVVLLLLVSALTIWTLPETRGTDLAGGNRGQEAKTQEGATRETA